MASLGSQSSFWTRHILPNRAYFLWNGDSGALAFNMDGNVLGLMNIRLNHVPHACTGV